MPLGEITAEALGGVVRLVARIVLELVFEVLVQGTGYAIIRLVRPRSDPSDLACGLVGFVVWALAAGAGIVAWRAAAS